MTMRKVLLFQGIYVQLFQRSMRSVTISGYLRERFQYYGEVSSEGVDGAEKESPERVGPTQTREGPGTQGGDYGHTSRSVDNHPFSLHIMFWI